METCDLETLCCIVQTFCMLITCCVAAWEFYRYKACTRYAVLSEYNVRYSQDKNIEAVTKYIIDIMEGKVAAVPSVHEKEMFLRFFEELEHQLKCKRIEEDDVRSLFAYYAVAAYHINEFRYGTELQNEQGSLFWGNYKNFVGRFPDIHKEIEDSYKHNNKFQFS